MDSTNKANRNFVTEINKQDKEEVRNTALTECGADKVTFSKDGTITIKRSYFYTFGMTPELFARKCEAHIKGFIATEKRDNWAAWPKTSYFVVKGYLDSDLF